MLFPTYRNTKELFLEKKEFFYISPARKKALQYFLERKQAVLETKNGVRRKKKHFRREAKRKTLERKRKFSFPFFRKAALSPSTDCASSAVVLMSRGRLLGKRRGGECNGAFFTAFSFLSFSRWKKREMQQKERKCFKIPAAREKKGSMAF